MTMIVIIDDVEPIESSCVRCSGEGTIGDEFCPACGGSGDQWFSRAALYTLAHNLAIAGGMQLAYRAGDIAGWDMGWHERETGEQRVCAWRPGRGEAYLPFSQCYCVDEDDEPNDGVDERGDEGCVDCGAECAEACVCGLADDACIRDDSTECDCSQCRAGEDAFWRDQGEPT